MTTLPHIETRIIDPPSLLHTRLGVCFLQANTAAIYQSVCYRSLQVCMPGQAIRPLDVFILKFTYMVPVVNNKVSNLFSGKINHWLMCPAPAENSRWINFGCFSIVHCLIQNIHCKLQAKLECLHQGQILAISIMCNKAHDLLNILTTSLGAKC